MATLLKQDEINRLSYDYVYTDKIMTVCMTDIVRRFGNTKSLLLHSSPKQIQERGRRLYERLNADAREYYSRIASHYYRRFSGGKKYDDDWLDEFLCEYNPVTKYVFPNEVDRRAARFVEAIIAVDDIPGEVDLKMRDWSRLIKQYGDLVTDHFSVEGMKDAGIRRVMWITQQDEKVCEDCHPRHGVIYNINDLPDKHHNCRCTLRAVTNNRQ